MRELLQTAIKNNTGRLATNTRDMAIKISNIFIIFSLIIKLNKTFGFQQ
jgi:hypothetical protein